MSEEIKAVSPAEKPKAPRPPKKYVVIKGPIALERGGPENHKNDGDVVELDNATAKHFSALGRIGPYIEDDD